MVLEVSGDSLGVFTPRGRALPNSLSAFGNALAGIVEIDVVGELDLMTERPEWIRIGWWQFPSRH